MGETYIPLRSGEGTELQLLWACREVLETAEQLKHPKWISVETRLPGCNEFLGISRITGRVQIYWKQGGKHSELTVGGMDIKKELSHWMPMPEKPETE